jgi:hypothetical protein
MWKTSRQNNNFITKCDITKVRNLNLEILKYLFNILVIVEWMLYELRISKTIKENENDRMASAPSVFPL